MGKLELIEYLKKQGFAKQIVQAFQKVDREDFVKPELKDLSYQNRPLPIGPGATISQPYTIAFMLNLLELKDQEKILEIGSGSGYVLALINQIVKKAEIYGIEVLEDLVIKSQQVLKEYSNIQIICANGRQGLKEQAPYDRILMSAAAQQLPKHLYSQLKEGGILVCPVQNSIWQIKKTKKGIKEKEFYGFAFVPLV